MVAVRTSTPIQSRRDLEEQERVLADRRQRALHAIMRMNGARGLPEDLAKRYHEIPVEKDIVLYCT